MEPIRCLLNTSSIRNRIVNEYCLKSGKHITEIITDYGSKGKEVKEIHKDFLGYPEKIIDNVFGKINTYYPSRSGVIQVSDGKETKLPPFYTMENLSRVAKD